MSNPPLDAGAEAVGKLPILMVLAQFLKPYRTQILIFLIAVSYTHLRAHET